MSDIHHPSGARDARHRKGGAFGIVPAVPHIDHVTDTAPPWTVPDAHDYLAARHLELVVPLERPRGRHEASSTTSSLVP